MPYAVADSVDNFRSAAAAWDSVVLRRQTVRVSQGRDGGGDVYVLVVDGSINTRSKKTGRRRRKDFRIPEHVDRYNVDIQRIME
jgi:hypothetical protein